MSRVMVLAFVNEISIRIILHGFSSPRGRGFGPSSKKNICVFVSFNFDSSLMK